LRPAWALILLITAVSARIAAQPISFTNINTTNGLSDNFIRSIVVDHKGFLWVGTNEGLNSYDGYTVTTYSRDEYPDIPSKTIFQLYCDSRDNIWMSSAEGVAVADANRNIRRVVLLDTMRNFNCRFVTETSSTGILLFTDNAVYRVNSKTGKTEVLKSFPGFLDLSRITDVVNFDKNRILVCTDSVVAIVDLSSPTIFYSQHWEQAQSACRVNENTIAISFSNGMCRLIDLPSGKTRKEYNLASFHPHGKARSVWSEVRPAPGNNILVGSSLFGFFIISEQGEVKHFTHDPANPFSLAGDKMRRVLSTPDGTIIAGTERYGLSIFNILEKQAVYQKFFTDGKGNYFDGFLTEITQDRDGSYWIGAVDRLIHWDKKTNTARFHQYDNIHSDNGIRYPEIYRLCIDRSGQVWVSILGSGPALFNKATQRFQLLPRDTSRSPVMKSTFISDLFPDSRGNIWAAASTGFYTIDPRTKKVTTFEKDSVLSGIANYRTHGFAEDKKGRIWISTYGYGIYCYDPVRRTLRSFRNTDGLLDNNCLDLFMDSRDDLYIAHYPGFSIIRADGSVEYYTKAKGLRFDKADAFIEDNDGMIWVSNAKCLLRFDPVTRSMTFFDEHDNLNKGGFKPSSAWKAIDGELLWGTQSGINYFYPRSFASVSEPLNVSIHKVIAGDSLLKFTGQQANRIRFRDNDIQIHFVAINLRGSQNIRYQYQLEGYDSKWQEGTDVRQVSYLSLPPGEYKFRLRASADRKNWVDASETLSFSVIAPLHMQWWFKALITLLVVGLLIFIFHRRGRSLRKKEEELETEQAINYFASSMYSHQTVDEIIWDVARNCIGRLQFEDCVIYLLDPEKNVLVQKAAYGPKSPRSFEITQPLDIPVGKGIVGSVAASGKAEVIPDTSKDPRYIVDDEARLSEISVPIMSDGKVLGVIDCEHSKKRFFTQKHLSILTTIASLCANKIIRARAEEAKKQTESMLVETKQKMAEAEMQALRAQMNPHFIFNCLNSINRYIVKSDQATASLYLTRFAKLIRLILDNSNSKNILLSNEIEALRLYIEMESLRFDHKFTYNITISDEVNPDSIEVPPLIIQPYIENAIWHGLLHKPGGGNLSVHIGLATPNMLECIIEDNGVGREKAGELKSKSVTKKKSLGMELTENRLLLLNQYAAVRSSVEIIDLRNDVEATGTKVILKIPFGE
jgi:putative methionine-R-sulfoxide reductase with GAF domain/streptogramin lyase